MRAPLPAVRAGSDRWLVSYADLMTLLFAFSMTLYAARAADAPVDSVSARRVLGDPAYVAPVSRGQGDPAYVASVSRVQGDPAYVASVSRVQGDPAYLGERLARELAGAIGARRIELIRDTRGLVVSMPDDAAFPVGSASANGETRRLIERVGDTLRTVPNAIRIEGHTDDVPIKTTRYESNWELSTARASAVVALLIGVGIDADRLSAAGYGQYHPLNPNDTPAHRARNRRVDLVILDVPVTVAQTDPPADPSRGGTRASP